MAPPTVAHACLRRACDIFGWKAGEASEIMIGCDLFFVWIQQSFPVTLYARTFLLSVVGLVAIFSH